MEISNTLAVPLATTFLQADTSCKCIGVIKHVLIHKNIYGEYVKQCCTGREWKVSSAHETMCKDGVAKACYAW